MKRTLLALLTLLPLSLAAQPIVSEPTTLTEFFTHVDDEHDRIAIAGDANGALIAWASAGDDARVHVANLLTGATFDIRKYDDFSTVETDLDPFLPALAKRGDRYLLAWVDPSATIFLPFRIQHYVAALPLDSTGRPLATVVVTGDVFGDVTQNMNVLAVSAAEGYRIYYVNSGQTYESRVRGNTNLTLGERQRITRNPISAAAATTRALVYSSPVFQSRLLISPPLPSDLYVYARPLGAIQEFSTTEAYRQTFYPPADIRTAVATNGDGFLVVWRELNDVRGLRLDADARPIGAPFTIAGPDYTSPNNTPQVLHHAVTWNGSHYIVAWERFDTRFSGDIVGASITAGGDVVSRFPIAATEDDERLPALAGGGGRTFVAYQFYGNNESRIAMRTITSASGRLRPARPR